MKKTFKDLKKEGYDKALIYAKYTSVRYFTALLFVLNLYWLYMVNLATPKLVFIPIIKFIIYTSCFIDQYLFMENKNYKRVKISKYILLFAGIIDSVLLLLSIFNLKGVFPYFNNIYPALIFFLVSLLLEIFIIFKIKKVEKNELNP